MTPDEREEAYLSKVMEYLNVLHVGVCAAYVSPCVPTLLLTLKQGVRSPGHDTENDRAAENRQKL